jgi:hypothetical protein
MAQMFVQQLAVWSNLHALQNGALFGHFVIKIILGYILCAFVSCCYRASSFVGEEMNHAVRFFCHINVFGGRGSSAYDHLFQGIPLCKRFAETNTEYTG